MAVVIGLPMAILTILAIPQHTVLQENEIRARGYGFSRVQIYRYAEARKMTIIQGFRRRDGTLVRRAGIVLDFVDGRRWSSADISDFKSTIDSTLFSYLREKTNLDPHYAESDSEIAPE